MSNQDNLFAQPASAQQADAGWYEYFDYKQYPYVAPPELRGEASRHTVCIVGGGPVGLCVALDLARYGIASVVLQQGDTVSYGSRAGCISRRSLEILARVGVVEPFVRQGLPWDTGYCYYRGEEVLRFTMPVSPHERFAPMVNLPQNYIEQYLVDAVQQNPLIDLRWQQRLAAVRQADETGVVLTVGTPEGEYELRCDWAVAADGARSPMRKMLGLSLQGETFAGRYLIADIRLETQRPAGRLAWFDPPSNPGATVLMHKLTEEIWRFDYQLHPDEDEQAAQDPDTVSARIAQHLEMIGEAGAWQLSWVSLYKANALTLERYRHGRVLFAGDAAHPIPIFGVRGLNSGLDDAHNLAWKLAYFIQGKFPEALLDTFSDERTEGTAENLRNARKSTVFMSPPSPAYTLMREAALSLSATHRWLSSLINPRQSAPVRYGKSAISLEDAGFDGGPGVGYPMAQFPVASAPGQSLAYLSEAVDTRFLALWFSAASRVPADLAACLAAYQERGVPLAWCVVSPQRPEGDCRWLCDEGGACAQAYGIASEGLYLIRPDAYVAGRWQGEDIAAARAALARLFSWGEQA